MDIGPRAAVIEQVTAFSIIAGHVWKILAAMEWSLQRPAKQGAGAQ